MKYPIVGISGRAGSGKDTVAEMIHRILETRGGDTTTICFAKPLKDIAQICGYSYDQLYDQNHKNDVSPLWNMSGRKFLQFVGTELFRNNIDPDFWVKLYENNVKTAIKKYYFPVLTPDVRFANESQSIKRMGGIVVYVDRPGISTMTHESEKLEGIDPDYIINNVGSLIDLKNKVYEFIDNRLFIG